MLWPKKYSYKEFDNEKNSWGSEIPPNPHKLVSVKRGLTVI